MLERMIKQEETISYQLKMINQTMLSKEIEVMKKITEDI